MKSFDDLEFSLATCKKELAEFSNFLSENPELQERRQIIPFFKRKRHLSAFMGTLVTDLLCPNKIAYEYELFGDFRADLIVGDSEANVYVFVEFQAGTAHSLFRKNRNKETLEWSPNFEAGFSQLVDWFWILDDMKQTGKYKTNFHPNKDIPAVIWPMLIAGRGTEFNYEEKRRLRWRLDKVQLDGKPVLSLTYDSLCQQLDERIRIESRIWSEI